MFVKMTRSLVPTSMHRATADKRQPGLRHYLLLLLVTISEENSKPQQLASTLTMC